MRARYATDWCMYGWLPDHIPIPIHKEHHARPNAAKLWAAFICIIRREILLSRAMAQASKRKRASSHESESSEFALNCNAISTSTREMVCPYLDSICRPMLDFDMEKVCCVTLSNMHIYCCLVCGKFFQGRGNSTPAYTHSVQAGHFVFIHLTEGRFYCLPDNYEVVDSSLDDIRLCLDPQFSPQDISQLDSNKILIRDVHGSTYLPGFRGINNICNTDYLNAIVQALSHVKPLRDFFLNSDSYRACRSPTIQQLGAFMRRAWSSYNFKSGANPHELVHVISEASQKRFANGATAECIDFMNWLLADLHKALVTGGAPATAITTATASSTLSTVVTQCFQGIVEITEHKYKPEAAERVHTADVDKWEESVRHVPFNHLSLDIPPPPLFKDGEGALVIPQVPIFELLRKFDGTQWTDTTIIKGVHIRRKYRLLKLPQYLIFHLVRTSDKSSFRKQRNPTIVTFPLKNLDMSAYISTSVTKQTSGSSGDSCTMPSVDIVKTLDIKALKALVTTHGNVEQKAIILSGCDKAELVRVASAVATQYTARRINANKYNLVANISRESAQAAALNGVTVGSVTESQLSRVSVEQAQPYKVHLHNKPANKWFELQDLRVTEIVPQLIGLSESSLLVYESALIGL